MNKYVWKILMSIYVHVQCTLGVIHLKYNVLMCYEREREKKESFLIIQATRYNSLLLSIEYGVRETTNYIRKFSYNWDEADRACVITTAGT